MARGLVHITVLNDQTARSCADDLLKPGDNQLGPAALVAFLGGLAVRGGRVRVRVDSSDSVDPADRATADITIVHANIATDTVTIGGVDLVEGTDFQDGADEIEAAANLAAAINDHALLGKVIEAVSDGVDTVTLTWWGYGRDGELITLSTDDATGFVLSAATLELASNTDTALEDAIEYRVGL